VDEHGVKYFTQLKKKRLLIGQEALLDVAEFDLAGRSKKALRNSLNSLHKKGLVTKVCNAPHKDELLMQLKNVSDEWLNMNKRKEIFFAQGGFDKQVLKFQECFDPKEQVVAFLNIIPDFAPHECTYDLVRKTQKAPAGCMDALVIQLVNYAKQKGLDHINLGLVPLSGITEPQNPAEQLMRFAYSKIKRFRQYKGLREFKEKYASEWLNKYLIYENDFDLLQLPGALNKIIQQDTKKMIN
jgi:phosphatidylglycerol lysyltransferase